MCLRFLSSLFNGDVPPKLQAYSLALTKNVSSVRAYLDLTDSYREHDGWESCTIQ